MSWGRNGIYTDLFSAQRHMNIWTNLVDSISVFLSASERGSLWLHQIAASCSSDEMTT
jgi:hypothetical protein